MELENIVLDPQRTMVLAIDVLKDFLKSANGFAFYDAKTDLRSMQWKVIDGIIPLLLRSGAAHITLIKSQYELGKFPPPYDKLCSAAPGTDFYLIDGIVPSAKIFTKFEHDPFSNPELVPYIEKKDIMDIVLVGFTLTNCINVAAQSALKKSNLRVIIPENCVGYRNEREADAARILEEYKLHERIVVLGSQRNIQYGNLP
ncbi:MAG TPA: isochorismatase family protein [Candidatus Nanoarchaeia archaeon]|nr:isochorismatase family protein [Candidatus Nanoarchaeia archaeon]